MMAVIRTVMVMDDNDNDDDDDEDDGVRKHIENTLNCQSAKSYLESGLRIKPCSDKDLGAGIAQLVVLGLAVHSVVGSILLWGHFQ